MIKIKKIYTNNTKVLIKNNMQFKVFGCKVNKYYTEKWLDSEYLKDKNGIFIATCVVTDTAKRKWIKFVKSSLKELKVKDNDGTQKIYISGCGVFKRGKVQKNFFEIYPELEEFKDKIVLLDEEPKISNTKTNSFKEKLKLNKIPQTYTKKFLLIQGGCDSFCSFCLTVYKRGKHFSRDRIEIVNEILEFEKKGGKEVVLTGVNLAAWGAKNTNDIENSKFSELLEYILENTKIPRIRISSIGPEFVNEKCLEIFKKTRIYPHFHYSVQSGSSKILKNMRRHYDGKYIKNLLEKTKKLKREDGIEVSIGADLIIGFPGENEDDFLETYEIFKGGLITKAHIFPFSVHNFGEKVPASDFKNQISEKIKKDRVSRLEYISKQKREEFKKRNIGKRLKVLIESIEKTENFIKWKGWTENYIEANERNFRVLNGKIERNEIIEGILE